MGRIAMLSDDGMQFVATYGRSKSGRSFWSYDYNVERAKKVAKSDFEQFKIEQQRAMAANGCTQNYKLYFVEV